MSASVCRYLSAFGPFADIYWQRTFNAVDYMYVRILNVTMAENTLKKRRTESPSPLVAMMPGGCISFAVNFVVLMGF